MAARETTGGIEIQTMELTGREPTFIRLARGEDPFYSQPPKAVPPAIVETTADEP